MQILQRIILLIKFLVVLVEQQRGQRQKEEKEAWEERVQWQDRAETPGWWKIFQVS